MTEAEILAAFNSVNAGLSEMTSLFGGNIIVIFAVSAVTVVWGMLAKIVRGLTNFIH